MILWIKWTHAFDSEKIAFHAYLSSTIPGTTSGQTIVFNRVNTNLGGGYNATTGVFTAPVAGIYVCSLTFYMYYFSSYGAGGELQIIKNGVNQMSVFLELDSNADEGSASGTAVLSLNKGDQVHVQADRGNMYIGGNYLSSFAGFFLR